MVLNSPVNSSHYSGTVRYLYRTCTELLLTELTNPLRLHVRLDPIWTKIKEGDSAFLARWGATLDRWIALGEQLMTGF